MAGTEESLRHYVAIIDHYVKQLTSYGDSDRDKAEIRILVKKLARDIMHWTNGYNDQLRAVVDKMLDEQGL